MDAFESSTPDPVAWLRNQHFFHDILAENRALGRMRLYGLTTEELVSGHGNHPGSENHRQHECKAARSGVAAPRISRPLVHVALQSLCLNFCHIDLLDLRSILYSSVVSLQTLEMESPGNLSHADLLGLLRFAGGNLKRLVIDDFAPELRDGSYTPQALDKMAALSAGAIDQILRLCPKLVWLDFIDASATPVALKLLIGSNLKRYQFARCAEVRYAH